MIAATEDIYKHTLELYHRSVQSLRGHQFSVDQFDFWNGLTGKIIAHATTIFLLTKGTKLNELTFNVDFGDSASVIVLARANIEAYATLYYLFLDTTISDDERTFRFAYEQMRGLLVRQTVDTPEVRVKRQQEQVLINRLYQTIENTQIVRNLQSTKTIRQIQRGRYQHISKTEMIIRSGFSELNARFIYDYLSDYTHSGYLSSLQFGQANAATKQDHYMELGMGLTAITLALSVRSLSIVFPSVRGSINGQEDQDLIGSLCALATDDTQFV